MKNQTLKEIIKIIEWRDGCVFKTKRVGFAWITFEHNPPNDGSLQFISISTSLMKELNHRTLRAVSEDTPDIDITTLSELKSYNPPKEGKRRLGLL